MDEEESPSCVRAILFPGDCEMHGRTGIADYVVLRKSLILGSSHRSRITRSFIRREAAL